MRLIHTSTGETANRGDRLLTDEGKEVCIIGIRIPNTKDTDGLLAIRHEDGKATTVTPNWLNLEFTTKEEIDEPSD